MTGIRNPQPRRSIAGELRTAMAAVPPAGGWTVLVNIIAMREEVTATGRAYAIVSIYSARYIRHNSPMMLACNCPNKMLAGWHNGDSGTANNITALAPKLPSIVV